ncbi:amidase [Microvirga sp. W0021]|uniref:Amidase n=1 Tax=Hohaiivirga grylli TaxID=3133970 RepID=A0ABV0BGN9_9HYPH
MAVKNSASSDTINEPATNISRRSAIKSLVGTVTTVGLLGTYTGANAKQAKTAVQATTAPSGATSIVDMPAWELSLNIHNKKLSVKEVMTAYLDQIDKVNGKVNAIVALQDRDGLLKQAEEKDKALASGNSMGWMHGFPQAIKDLEETKGIVTAQGSPAYKDWVPDYDSFMVKRMKAHGALITGKTNTPEFGYGSHTYNPVYGATGNPYDPSKSAGGSSGGAACSVAMRMQPVADGSDFMGSLRNPAGWCNVFGFRPSWGLVPDTVDELFINQFSINGPMGRSIPDMALLLNTISGYSNLVPQSLEDDARLKALTPANVRDRMKADQKGKRMAWLGDWDGYLAMEPDVLEVCQGALDAITAMGLKVETIKAPTDGQKLWDGCWLPHRHICASGLKSLAENPEKRKLLKPEAIFEYEGSKNYSGQQIYEASVMRGQWYNKVQELFEEFDYIAVPTAQMFPFDKEMHWPKEVAGRKMDTYHRWMEIVTPWTLCGSPVVAIPAGFNKAGLSMGIQVIGKPRNDFEVLQFAYMYELATDIVRKNPPKIV